MFNFKVQHVKGTAYIAANGLSWQPWTKLDDLDDLNKEDVDNFIIVELDYLRILAIAIKETTKEELTLEEPLDKEYLEYLQKLA